MTNDSLIESLWKEHRRVYRTDISQYEFTQLYHAILNAQHTQPGVEAGDVERVARAIFKSNVERASREIDVDLLTYEEARDSKDDCEHFAYECAIEDAQAAIAAMNMGDASTRKDEEGVQNGQRKTDGDQPAPIKLTSPANHQPDEKPPHCAGCFADVGMNHSMICPINPAGAPSTAEEIRDDNAMHTPRVDRLTMLLSALRIGCTIRYQAYEYAKEGTPEYAFVSPFCIDATAHLRKLLTYAEEAEKIVAASPMRESGPQEEVADLLRRIVDEWQTNNTLFSWTAGEVIILLKKLDEQGRRG